LGHSVELIFQEKRCGKASGVNFALKHSIGDIIVISDSDARLEKNALTHMMRFFSDDKVGIVGGELFTKSNVLTAETQGTGFLRSFESFLAQKENLVDSAVNIGGELMAFRKELGELDVSNLAEDLDCVLNARIRGYRIIQDSKAVAWEFSPTTEIDVISQKRRITVGTLQNLFKYRKMLYNPNYGLFGLLIFPGHKLFQVLNPFFILLVFVFSLILYSLNNSTSVSILLIVLCTTGLIFFLSFILKINRKPFSFFRYFVIIQVSVVKAWYDFLRKKYTVNWEMARSKRTPFVNKDE
jgi:cellulose synthase/poly-beta-1,6-N-acetylglucosamine synthase-like glycosyltransferase